MAIVFRPGGAVTHRDDRLVFTQRTATSIATALYHYHTEYEALPDVADRVTTGSVDGARLLNILSGHVLADVPLGNPRGIGFLSVREKTGKPGGVVYDSGKKMIVAIYDEWGNPFTVFLGKDADEVLLVKLGAKETRLMGRHYAVVSPGKDGELGTADDVKTW